MRLAAQIRLDHDLNLMIGASFWAGVISASHEISAAHEIGARA